MKRFLFEFDAEKSSANKSKHGLDFTEAQKLWGDERKLFAQLDYEFEDRYMIIAALKDKLWTAIFTYRNEKIRLISVRRSRKNEEKEYFR